MDLGSVFKLVWRGWFAGVTVIFLPLFALVALFNSDAPKGMLLAVLLLPLVAACQGLIIGGIVVAGLKVWRPKALS